AAAFPPDVHRAAAVITYLVPGLRFFHEGQFEGRRQRVSMHLARRPDEPVDEELRAFYEQLLGCVKVPAARARDWQLPDCQPAWDGNATCSCFVAFAWQGADGSRLLVTVNYGPTQGQCYVALPWPDLRGQTWRLRDRLTPASYDRPGEDL